MLKMKRLTPREQELLAGFEVKNNRAQFMGPQINDWAAVKKVMIAIGGTWVKGKTSATGGFVFADDVDAAEVVRLARSSGEILDPNQYDCFFTPKALASHVVASAFIRAGMGVLEPSAGQGALALAVREAVPGAKLLCVEILPRNREVLRSYGFFNYQEPDFMALPQTPTYDRVVMNPPFSKRQDIAHVRHAHGFLRPGGRLSAIMSGGVKFRDDRIGNDFRAWLDQSKGTIEDLPENSFRESGTGVRTVLVTAWRLR